MQKPGTSGLLSLCATLVSLRHTGQNPDAAIYEALTANLLLGFILLYGLLSFRRNPCHDVLGAGVML